MIRMVLALLVACSHTTSYSTLNSPVIVSAPNEWTVTVSCSRGAHSAVGVVVTIDRPTTIVPTPHARLAAARAWHAIALATETSDPGFSARAARTGLEEITKDCADCTGDHSQHIAVGAEDALADDPQAAASMFIRALRRRMRIYVKRHPSVKRQPSDRE